MASPWPVVVARLQRASATGWPRGRHANTSLKNTMSGNWSAATERVGHHQRRYEHQHPGRAQSQHRVGAFESAEQHDQQGEQERRHNGPQVAVEVARPQVRCHGKGHAGHCHRGCHHRRALYTLPQDQPRQAGGQERHGGRDHGDVGHLDPLQRVDVEGSSTPRPARAAADPAGRGSHGSADRAAGCRLGSAPTPRPVRRFPASWPSAWRRRRCCRRWHRWRRTRTRTRASSPRRAAGTAVWAIRGLEPLVGG